MLRTTATGICRRQAGNRAIHHSSKSSNLSAAQNLHSSSRPFPAFAPSRRTLGYVVGGLAVAGGATWLVSSRGENEGTPLAQLAASPATNDPLSALNPDRLTRTTAHLTTQAVSELVRQWVVFAVSEQSALVEAGPWILGKIEWTRDNVPLLGSAVWAVFSFGMESTFYKVFVGGESVPGCEETVNKYAKNGVGVMFNYSAEAPLGASKPSSGIDQSSMREIHNAVVEAAKLAPPVFPSDAVPVTAIKPSLLAIKLTGLIYDASLLARASSALANNSSTQRGGMIASSTSSRPFPESPELSDDDHLQLAKLYEGLRRVAGEAQKQGVRLLVDAEQSWFQPAIDHFANLLSEEFNKPDPSHSGPAAPIVYNTYQCYLRTTPAKLEAALAHATSNNYSFGAKLVRGAYVESERKRHSVSPVAESEPCIVWNSKDETDNCYDSCASLLQDRIASDFVSKERAVGKAGVGVCLASHNGTSMRKFLENLRKAGLAKDGADGRLEVDDRLRGRVAFGQLMGMSDNLTATLLSLLPPPTPSAVPLVVKYVPYATLSQGLPYLIRRANENQSILKGDPTSGRGGAREERRAVGREIRSRMGLSF
ncbi:proline dehydrogenase [Sporobolomyces koalae]|uniref:proline dehydrogenase n=1 Tax=Sporobolomyces koalae TaxID=500713 RepID=UPI00316C5B32